MIEILNNRVYSLDSREYWILARGEYRSYKVMIISYGSHPCMYFSVKKDHKLYGIPYDSIDFYCHGGLTYGELNEGRLTSKYTYFDEGDYILGWDYSHPGDYMNFGEGYEFEGHRYSVEELIEEVKESIDDYEDNPRPDDEYDYVDDEYDYLLDD